MTSIPSTVILSVMPASIPSTDTSSAIATSIPSTDRPLIVPTLVSSVTLSFVPTPQPLSQPSSHPSSVPTHTPTKLDLLDVNLLNTKITSAVIAVKTKYYLGYYVAYFIAVYILLVMLDMCQLCKAYTDMLHDSADSTKMYTSPEGMLRSSDCKGGTDCSKVLCINMTVKSNVYIDEIYCSATAAATGVGADCGGTADAGDTEGGWSPSRSNTVTKRYSAAFYAFLQSNRYYLGCEAVLFISGINCTVFEAPKGMIEDYLLYLCNHEPFLSCMLSADGAPFNRDGRRLIYIIQCCMTFFLAFVSNAIFDYMDVSSYANFLFDVLVISPISASVAAMFYLLYACPCLDVMMMDMRYGRHVGMLRCLGKLAVLPLVFAGGVLLVMSSVFSRGRNFTLNVLTYLWNVQLVSLLQNLVFTLLEYTSYMHISVRVLLPTGPVYLIRIGSYYCEYIVYHQLKEGDDYRVWSLNTVLLRIDMVACTRFLLNHGLMSMMNTAVPAASAAGIELVDVEMSSAVSPVGEVFATADGTTDVDVYTGIRNSRADDVSNDYAIYSGGKGVVGVVDDAVYTSNSSDSGRSSVTVNPMLKVAMVSNPMLARVGATSAMNAATLIHRASRSEGDNQFTSDDVSADTAVRVSAGNTFATATASAATIDMDYSIDEDETLVDGVSDRTLKILDSKSEDFVKAYRSMDSFMSSLKRTSVKRLGSIRGSSSSGRGSGGASLSSSSFKGSSSSSGKYNG